MPHGQGKKPVYFRARLFRIPSGAIWHLQQFAVRLNRNPMSTLALVKQFFSVRKACIDILVGPIIVQTAVTLGKSVSIAANIAASKWFNPWPSSVE
jgi:hypothetical protein